jgi:hypothetical protein
MRDGSDRWQELDSLLDRVLDGLYEEADLRRLNEILRNDAEACRRYVLYVELHGRLAWGEGLRAEADQGLDDAAIAGTGATGDEFLGHSDVQGEPQCSAVFPVIIETSPGTGPSMSPFGSFLFSYAVAAATVFVGLLIGWSYQVSISPQMIAKNNGLRPGQMILEPAPGTVYVGQITGSFEPRWSNPEEGAVHTYVPLGRRFTLASGLMEISYNTGAHVILQGPCTYRVESRSGGYLEIGKVTVRIEKKPQGGAKKSEQLATGGTAAKDELFAVHTPTAVITDLGTEFGVEVDASGASEAHVFRGRVEVRSTGGNVKPVSLAMNESARVGGKGQAPQVLVSAAQKPAFVRKMPRMTPIALFNTGTGLKGGQQDPHWKIVSRSDDPTFKPQMAVVRGMKPDEYFMVDDRDHSQWLSLLPGDREYPQEITFTFRTEFDLTGMLASTAVLRGKFVADDRLVGIRLNGRRLAVPAHPDGGPFLAWTSFQIASGFVKGKNVLEFEVLNSNPYISTLQRRKEQSRMSFRAELEGAAMRDPWTTGDGAAGGKTLQGAPAAGKTAIADRPNRNKTRATTR